MQGCTKTVALGGSAVTIQAEGARAVELVMFLLAHVPTSDLTPVTTYLVLERPLRLLRHGNLLYTGNSEAVLAELLLGEVGHQLAAHSRGGLTFHAACVASPRGGILLPGASGAGKTTLTVWLVHRGLTYLTDELVFIPNGPHGTQTAHAFTRPLHVKVSARTALESQLTWESPYRTEASELIAPSALSDHPPQNDTQLSLILFPRYRPHGELDYKCLSKAQAGLSLMQCLVNARNLPGHGFTAAVQLAETVPAYRLGYSSFEQLEEVFQWVGDRE